LIWDSTSTSALARDVTYNQSDAPTNKFHHRGRATPVRRQTWPQARARNMSRWMRFVLRGAGRTVRYGCPGGHCHFGTLPTIAVILTFFKCEVFLSLHIISRTNRAE
jgi:hypothetical protein